MRAQKAWKMLVVSGLVGALLGGLSPARGTAAESKVNVCHREGNGSFHLITVASSAVPAHRQHGDALPGQPVPGKPGFTFDAACQEVRLGPRR